jgi:hypothetical protein
MLAERQHLGTQPRRYVVERVGICVKHAGALEIDVEHIHVDELGTTLVCGLCDRPRERLLAGLGHDEHDLSGLHVRAKLHGKLGKRADMIRSAAIWGETYAYSSEQRNSLKASARSTSAGATQPSWRESSNEARHDKWPEQTRTPTAVAHAEHEQDSGTTKRVDSSPNPGSDSRPVGDRFRQSAVPRLPPAGTAVH